MNAHEIFLGIYTVAVAGASSWVTYRLCHSSIEADAESKWMHMHSEVDATIQTVEKRITDVVGKINSRVESAHGRIDSLMGISKETKQ